MILRLNLWFLIFVKGTSLPNFNSIVERELLIMEVLQLEGFVSNLLRNLHACLTILGWMKMA